MPYIVLLYKIVQGRCKTCLNDLHLTLRSIFVKLTTVHTAQVLCPHRKHHLIAGL